MVRTIPVVLLGLGNVGRVLLRQILETKDVAAQRTNLRLALVGLADISGMIFDANGIAEETLQKIVQTRDLLNSIVETRPLVHLENLVPSNTIVADVTASKEALPLIQVLLNAGSGVVLANKNPMAAEWANAQALFNHPKLRYECTAGAGLPVISTLRYLLDTGDEVLRITGCMSGTLGYLCAEMEGDQPYSAVVAQARALGYTEPDPRDDLSGYDVVRKALILARTAGWPLEMADIHVEALYPKTLAELSTEEFMAEAQIANDNYARLFRDARAQKQTLRYIAQVGPTGGHVGLQAVAQDSPIGILRGPANYFEIQTRRYRDVPMVISGPGAGPEVTAAGVLGDILELAQLLALENPI